MPNVPPFGPSGFGGGPAMNQGSNTGFAAPIAMPPMYQPNMGPPSNVASMDAFGLRGMDYGGVGGGHDNRMQQQFAQSWNTAPTQSNYYQPQQPPNIKVQAPPKLGYASSAGAGTYAGSGDVDMRQRPSTQAPPSQQPIQLGPMV
jgi:hypothetical protein